MVSPMKGRRSIKKAEWYAGIDDDLIDKIESRVRRHIARGAVTKHGNARSITVYTHVSIDSSGGWRVAAYRKALNLLIGKYPDMSVSDALARAGELLFPAKKTPEEQARLDGVMLSAQLRENRERELEAIRRTQNCPLAIYLRENYPWHDLSC